MIHTSRPGLGPRKSDSFRIQLRKILSFNSISTLFGISSLNITLKQKYCGKDTEKKTFKKIFSCQLEYEKSSISLPLVFSMLYLIAE